MTLSSPVLNDHWRDLESWTTAAVAPSKQFDHWRDFVVDAHLHWNIHSVHCEQFPAFIRQGRHEGFRLVHLTAARAGVIGRRAAREIAQDSEALYNLIYVAEGSQCLEFGDHEVRLDPGTFALWDSTQPMNFNTGEGLRQITFSVPRKRLDDALPRAQEFCGHAMQATSGIGKLFIDCMLALETSFGELSNAEAGEVLEATTGMLVATLAAKLPLLPLHRGFREQLQLVMAGINRQLDDPQLTPQRVARDNGMSQRHLYRLFAEANTTPASWIRQRRLEQCRRDLAARSCTHLSILEVAVRWGFFDSSSFCRMFRQEYGVSPRQMRSSTDAGRA